MARKRRARRPDPRQVRTMMPENPGWRWRTLPVWLALTGGFILGFYVCLFATRVDPETWGWVALYVAVGGFSLGLSRLVRWLTERWVARRRAKAAAAERASTAPARPARPRKESPPPSAS